MLWEKITSRDQRQCRWPSTKGKAFFHFCFQEEKFIKNDRPSHCDDLEIMKVCQPDQVQKIPRETGEQGELVLVNKWRKYAGGFYDSIDSSCMRDLIVNKSQIIGQWAFIFKLDLNKLFRKNRLDFDPSASVYYDANIIWIARQKAYKSNWVKGVRRRCSWLNEGVVPLTLIPFSPS